MAKQRVLVVTQHFWPENFRINDIVEGFECEDTEILNIGDSVRARRIIDGTDAGRHMVLATLDRLGYL